MMQTNVANGELPQFDSLDVDSAGTVDAVVERAYRRGFYQGAYLAFYEMLRGVGDAELSEWLDRVHTWRYHAKRLDTGRVKLKLPPELPTERPALRAQRRAKGERGADIRRRIFRDENAGPC